MGGIAVAHNFDGRPADPALLDRMLAAMAHRGPDGCGRWIEGATAMGHLAFHTTLEARGHSQPIMEAEAGLALVFDGRIDNRDELIAALRARDSRPRRGDDAEIALRAWQCWGAAAAERLEGDFVFAVWDKRNHELVCARDQAGIVPLYYHCDGAIFLAASELHALFEYPAVPREPNEGFIGEHLPGFLFNRTETPYRRIMRLEPAHLLNVRRGAAEPRKYFELAPETPIRYRDDREYADHFRDTFGSAVRRRLRTITPVGAELSGGLDSTSVTGMAARLIRDGVAVVPGFETFSNLFNEPNTDERAYSDEAARFCRVENNRIFSQEAGFPYYVEAIRRYRDLPGAPNSASFLTLRHTAADKGVRVMLTGLGGDQWMVESQYYYADLIRQRRFGDLLAAVSRDGGTARGKLLRLIKSGLWPLAPEPMRRVVIHHVLRRPFPASIRPDFAREIDLAGRIARSRRRPAGMSFGHAAIRAIFTDPSLAQSFEISNRDAAACRIEERHPFYDLRLVRFFMNIPDEQRWRPGLSKYVLREAMRGLIPELVRRRTGKAVFDTMFARALKNLGAPERFRQSRLEALGWVDGDALRRMCAEFIDNPAAAGPWPVWNAFELELWMAEIFGHDGAASTRPFAR
jgi:asparagine synthase (glutamine-hydrolysing)